MIILWSDGDSLQFQVPSELLVRRVVPGVQMPRREYALGELRFEGGATQPVAVRARTRRKWRVPRPGKEIEVVVWSLHDIDGAVSEDRYDQPSSGTALAWIKDGDLVDEMAARRRGQEGTSHG